MSEERSIAHVGHAVWYGENPNTDGFVGWRPATPPDFAMGRTTGRLRSCEYCGSMHPHDVAEALKAGATIARADNKYGWPHKFYISDIPNPHAGLLEHYTSTSTRPKQEDIDSGDWVELPTGRYDEYTGKPTFTWYEKGQPAKDTTQGKFYTVHLKDATTEDRDVIERALGMRIHFTDDEVSWEPIR